MSQGLGDLSSFVETKNPSIVNLDWLEVSPEDYDNIPSENTSLNVVPELMEAWRIRGEGNGGRSLPNSAAVVVRASDDSVSGEDVVKVTETAKKASMMGIAGKEMISYLRDRFPAQVINASAEALRKVAAEQGLLGNVYVDLGCFDTCREAASLLGAHKVRLAKFAVGAPRKEASFVDSYGNCRELGKKVVASVEYTPEVLSYYENHLRLAGFLGKDEKITSKEDLQNAFLKGKQEKEASLSPIGGLTEQVLPSSLKGAAKEDESDKPWETAEAREVLAFIQGEMMAGKIGAALKESIKSAYSHEQIKKNAADIAKIASQQGVRGPVFVDVSLFKSASDAVSAIRTASVRPSYLIQSYRQGDFDNTLSVVASATGLQELPRDGKIDLRVASALIDDLVTSDRIDSRMAASMKEKMAFGFSPLSVIKDAYTASTVYNREARQGGVLATEYQAPSREASVDVGQVRSAATEAISRGISVISVESRVASVMPASEAHGLVRDVIASMGVVPADALVRCTTEKYPIHRGSRIASSKKCASCIHSTGGVCAKQSVAFDGVDTSFEMNLSRAATTKTASSKDEIKLAGLEDFSIDFSNVVEPPRVSIDSDLDGRTGMDAAF